MVQEEDYNGLEHGRCLLEVEEAEEAVESEVSRSSLEVAVVEGRKAVARVKVAAQLGLPFAKGACAGCRHLRLWHRPARWPVEEAGAVSD